ncbi:hypothetical protein A3C05_03420 [Candidatus Giovannonibacteria bacterium RIFCSPHIGHO2_02_FULL_45_40]|uniref:Tyr recombinase domain-containing protein n=1 Tax=Candidatus Giovannonibacteria bacterium RIFCSPHIGHO2_02_FULL_45_40 TaxID=1798337 RepID=A0A1F5WAA3_9BACT|nr:MAG: hypothetical protein A2656_01145 [Candidatus Giovannonibacteria bacterium RIFCSPHIGHO2_01_FULL_44_100]OGF72588.1 MAG: hypothetical protein A3C05_03420 [Candidatus Giovannonibacteria bacterium RIFCSPHIGHO2_02_FULL_45_40]
MATRKRNSSWQVDFRHNHQRYRVKSPENSKAGAEAYEASLRQKLARGEALRPPKEEKTQQEREQKFKDFARKWFEVYVKPNNKHSEIKNKEYALRRRLVPFFGEIQIDKITTLHVNEYVAQRTKERTRNRKPPCNKTINNELIILGTCLRTAQEWYDLPKIPKLKKLKAPPSRFDFLSQEESAFLLQQLSGVWYDIVLAGLDTGLRRGELEGLQWSDINWHNKTLTVRHSWCETQKALTSPKSNRERHISLTNRVCEILARRRKESGFVFLNEQGKKIESKRINDRLSGACKKIGLRRITCHVLRHTFASHLAMAGVSMQKIQELLGHESIQTTMRYAHLAPSSSREAISVLEASRAALPNFGHYLVTSGNQALPMSADFAK